MAKKVVTGAMVQCSFVAALSALIVLPTNRVMAEGGPAANIMDHKPVVNIPTFGMCTAPTNPAVIAAMSAALGVPTPAPCVLAKTDNENIPAPSEHLTARAASRAIILAAGANPEGADEVSLEFPKTAVR